MYEAAKKNVRIIIKALQRIRSLGLLCDAFRIKRRLVQLARSEHVVVISLTEHLGDVVACEPVARYVREREPSAYIVWTINKKFADVVRCNPSVNEVVPVSCFSEWIYLKKLLSNTAVEIIDLHIDGRYCTRYGLVLNNPNNHGITLDNYYFQGTILEAFSLAANLPRLDWAPRCHLPDDVTAGIDLPQRFMVIHATSNEESRNWTPPAWNSLFSFLEKENIHVVEVGHKNVIRSTSPYYINLCSKLTLPQVGFVISKAALFIGIDSAFAHFANALSVPGVILLGHYRHFKKYMPYTGGYGDGSLANVIQYDGKASEIPVAEVIHNVQARCQLQDIAHDTVIDAPNLSSILER
jgi:heptosyltransferase-3